MTKIINPNKPDYVDRSQQHVIDRYIGENSDNIRLIEETILNNRAVLIDAATGTGKSSVVSALFNKWINEEGRRCYYLLPKIIQQHQFATRYLKGFLVINANATEKHRIAAQQIGANITWQGFLTSEYDKALSNNDVVIIDEAHLLINNQSYVSETKHLVRKLQQGKYRLVFMSGTPNFLALRDLFGCEFLSFHLTNPVTKTLKPYLVKGTLMKNVIHYLSPLDFVGDGLHIIRVNDKEKHHELSRWAQDTLKLPLDAIQIINKDVADPRWIDKDYKYLIDNEAISPEKKLLITTVFSDEGINISNLNIKSLGIFYDPSLNFTSQRCRDSVIQFCSRFRNLHKIDKFVINLFLPEMPEGSGTQDYFNVFKINEKRTKYLLRELSQTRKEFGANMVMQAYPQLFNGTDLQSNLVVEVGDKFFKPNRQGLYFNTKNQIDCWKSNKEFMEELSPYFNVQACSSFDTKPKVSDSTAIDKVKEERLRMKIESFEPMKKDPANILIAVVNQSKSPELKKMIEGLEKTDLIGTCICSPLLIKTLEEEAPRLLFLKHINYPIGEFSGLLLRKREYREKMRFLRFMLSRKVDMNKSMNNLYNVNFYAPLATLIEEIKIQFMGQGFKVQKDIISWINKHLPYPVKIKQIKANMILDELFVTKTQRSRVGDKKQSYVSIIKERGIADLVFDFLFYNEQFYPSIASLEPLKETYLKQVQDFNAQQNRSRSAKIEKVEAPKSKLGQLRCSMEKSKQQLISELKANPEFMSKVNRIADEVVRTFAMEIDKMGGILKKLEQLDEKQKAA